MGLFIVGGTHFLYFCMLVYLGYAGDGFLDTEKNLFALYFYHSFILFYTMPFLKSYVVHENAIGGKSYKEIDISFKCQVYEMTDNTK